MFEDRALEVCGCGEIRGPVATREAVARNSALAHPALCQECACDRQRRAAAGIPDPPRWDGHDHNHVAELCQCCALVVLRSGSRWSPFFCDECRPRVREVNDEAGFALIPVGRHSLMNGVSVRPGVGPVEVSRFSAALKDLSARMGVLHEWGSEATRRNLTEFGMAERAPVALTDYLTAASAREDLREERYIEMLQRFLAQRG